MFAICPDICLYQAKTTQQIEKAAEAEFESHYAPHYNWKGEIVQEPPATIKHRAFPAIGARKETEERKE